MIRKDPPGSNKNMKSRVVLVECPEYRQETVSRAVQKGIDLMGGVGRFARKNETLLLKPNLLAGEPPEKSVTTHPAVFRAVGEVFKNQGIRLVYGDSPGIGNPEKVARKSGLKAMADELNIPLTDFKTGRKVTYAQALVARHLTLARAALDAHGIISISKMKTHALTGITGAVKNSFGCVPGFLKEEFHLKMKDINLFCSLLVDITTYLRPRLHIMDGIVAMEGNGPRSGDPKNMNVLLFSTDPVALDSVFCQLIDFNPLYVPYLKIGQESGLGTCNPAEIEVSGDNLKKFIRTDFKIKRRPIQKLTLAQNLPHFIKNIIISKPIIDYRLCTNCGSCVLQCPIPEKAVNWKTGKKKEKPRYDYSRCIRCYCCQEICPEKAISVKTPFLGKIIFR
jgi:uncharacterized protein (DUF362 family)/NAD-dependent dihydropyrimidine dehydrogenase PreA subunit